MDILINITKSTLEEGFMYAILALGVYITFTVLDFPDMTVDGTVPFGALVSGIMILHGINPWLCCLAAFLAGAAAGSITGLLHVKLKIQPLLCGILVMTGLISINLVVVMKGTSGLTIASFFNSPTIFTTAPATLIPEKIGGYSLRIMIVSLIIAVICKLILDIYLKTKSGLLLRAAGSNEQYVTMLARNPGASKILGLAIGNGFAAFAGAVISHAKKSADVQMGTGMVVIGLASVIIGLSLFRGVHFINSTTKVLLGTLVYKICLSVALALGLPQELLKLLMVVLFVLALVFSNVMENGKKRGIGGLFRVKA